MNGRVSVKIEINSLKLSRKIPNPKAISFHFVDVHTKFIVARFHEGFPWLVEGKQIHISIAFVRYIIKQNPKS